MPINPGRTNECIVALPWLANELVNEFAQAGDKPATVAEEAAPSAAT